MGKRVLAGLLATAAIFVLSRPQSAQEAPPQPADAFKPGKFFTQDDYDHLKAALEVINLTPEDLKYEKKHKPNDTLRLKVCDAALDDPLSLPLLIERCAREFSTSSTPANRSLAAASLLDRSADRWSAVELQKDTRAIREFYERIDKASLEKGKDWTEEEKAKAAEARKVIFKEMDDYQRTQFYGGTEVVSLVEESELLNLRSWSDARDVIGPVGAMQRCNALPPAEQNALAWALPEDIFGAPAGVPGSREPVGTVPDNLTIGAKADIEAALVAGCRLSTWLFDQAHTLRRLMLDGEKRYVGDTEHNVEGVTGGILGAWEGTWGKVVIGGTGPNTYEGDDFIGIIDLGGDDVYRGRVASGIGLPGHAPISFVLDLGGNDRYEGGDFTQGFGFLGVGILHDLGGGNDYYSAGFCAQGCGLCGYGELYDDGGNDIYLADSGAQGAGCFGYGHLIDKSGNDIYRGARYVQGFAQVMGVGVLTDGDGNDLYYAGGKYLHQPLWNDRYQSLSQGFAIGNRNDKGVGTGGGVALLLDEGNGNDVYQCDIYGQGSSYWYSLGMLVDRGGNDTYTAGQYCQGAGIHLSAGILVDLAGNDTYSMGVGLGQGAAHDWAVGWLIDRAGNDSYQGSGQGMGLNFSVGILLDCAGDDSHGVNSEGSIGKGHNNDISLLLDLAGTDSYGPKEIKDGEFTRRGLHQLVYDVPPMWFPGVDASTLPTKQEPAPETVTVQNILISWKDRGVELKDPDRTKQQAEVLRDQLLKQARTKDTDWNALVKERSEDSDSKYEVERGKDIYVPEFQSTSLSLGVGQVDCCESIYGFHIIKRLE